jgi:hypothetical protein
MHLHPGQFMPCEQAGDYGIGEKGEWWAWAPCKGASPAKITLHQVTEHDDGTITASPSILMNFGAHGVTWHGYLERGIWREV